VEKDEFMSLIWPEVFVEESNLTQNIFILRKILGENPEGQQYIETVPKRGYRFLAAVRESPEQSAQLAAEQHIGVNPATEPEAKLGPDKPITSLAVLPMFNESLDPKLDYLTSGIMENVVNTLSQLPGLQVMACSTVFRYKGQELHPQEVGRELGVEAVVVGKVLLVEETLIIRLELVDVENGWQIWGEQYDHKLSEILEAQEKISRKVLENLRWKLSEEPKRLFKPSTENIEAYLLYLKGRYFLNKRTAEGYKTAIDSFQQAINIDMQYALAYSGLADSYILFDFYGLTSPLQTVPIARAAAVKAAEIYDTLPEVHTTLACIKMVYDRDIVGAEREFKRALELNPKYAQAHNGYSHCLIELGRHEDSFAESKQALELDPLDLDINLYLGWHYLFVAQYEQAIKQLRRTLELGPNFYRARLLLGMAYRQKGDIPAAIAEFEKAGLLEDTVITPGFLGQAYAVAGRTEEALNLLAWMKQRASKTYVPPFSIALIYTGLGQNDEAFAWLEKAVVEQSHWRGWFEIIPEFNALRSDPRYADLARRVRLQL
jgi:TolB-like protein/Tfp pilus assembly protein PilF